jgi:hypothetical protein
VPGSPDGTVRQLRRDVCGPTYADALSVGCFRACGDGSPRFEPCVCQRTDCTVCSDYLTSEASRFPGERSHHGRLYWDGANEGTPGCKSACSRCTGDGPPTLQWPLFLALRLLLFLPGRHFRSGAPAIVRRQFRYRRHRFMQSVGKTLHLNGKENLPTVHPGRPVPDSPECHQCGRREGPASRSRPLDAASATIWPPARRRDSRILIIAATRPDFPATGK